MIVRYTPRAREDLSRVFEYLNTHSPRGAQKVSLAIKRAIELIAQRPEMGREAGKAAVRVLPVSRYPYLVYWTVEADVIWLVHIPHGARKPWGG